MSQIVTVIMASYNHEAYVGAAIEGLLRQTYEPLEVIIIDDGSTDNSVNVIGGYAQRCEERFFRYSFISKNNSGLGKTLNRGIEAAVGDYILINASDDVAEPTLVEDLLPPLIENKDIALVGCNNYFIDGEGQRCFWSKDHHNVYTDEQAAASNFMDWLQQSNPEFDIRGDEYGSYRRLLRRNHIANGYLQRKSSLIDAGLYDPDLPLEDWPMHLRLARNYRFAYVDKLLFNYRWHGANNILDAKFKLPSQRAILRQEKSFACANGYADVWKQGRRAFIGETLHQLRKWLITINTGSRRRQLRLFGVYLIHPPR